MEEGRSAFKILTGKSTGKILLNIMFHAPMGRFQLELIYYFTYFSPSSQSEMKHTNVGWDDGEK